MHFILLFCLVVHLTSGCQKEPEKTGVFLTVSSLASTSSDGNITIRSIELNWLGFSVTYGDWLGLFTEDPSKSLPDPLIKVVLSSSSGHHTSNISFPYFDLENTTAEELGFWVAYIHDNKVMKVNSLKQQPHWMEQNKDVLKDKQLTEVMLPGTHDSGAYRQYNGRISELRIPDYSVAQDEGIGNQLRYGIRIFDLRVGYYDHFDEKWMLVHGFTLWNPLSEAISALRKFLQETNEIVFIDFHGFEKGFDGTEARSRHIELIKYIYSNLGQWMAPRFWGDGVTLDKLWSSDKRLIVSYGNSMHLFFPHLWSSLTHKWGNVRHDDDLFDFLSQTMEESSDFDYRWSSMAELTPSAVDIVLKRFGGLRGMANDVNRDVTDWFRNLWWSQANAVSVDFFLGTDIVNVAIESNRLRGCTKVG